jgi:hypothetical protein
MPLAARLRLYAVNCLIAGILGVMLIDALPQSPPPLRDAVQPIAQRVGLGQHWNVFTPPDGINVRVRAEITYQDGQQTVWRSPDWPELSLWQRFIGHRHEEWLDTAWGQEDAPVWPGWARHLARQMRPDDPQADRGAEVKFVVEESLIRSPELQPWPSWRTPPEFKDHWTLTIEKLP